MYLSVFKNHYIKLFSCLLLFTLLFASAEEVFAQKMTEQEIKNYMCSYKWFLRRYEAKGQYYTTPPEYQGTHLVFLPEGKLYYHKKGQEEGTKSLYT